LSNQQILEQSKNVMASDKVNKEQRSNRYSQHSALIILTGAVGDDGREKVARQLEISLFNEGHLVYCTTMPNLIHSFNKGRKKYDILQTGADEEDFSRFVGVAQIMMDAGMILIVTANEHDAKKMEYLKNEFKYIGIQMMIEYIDDLPYANGNTVKKRMLHLKQQLQTAGYIF